MIVCTDSVEYADSTIADLKDWQPMNLSRFDSALLQLVHELYPAHPIYVTEYEMDKPWTHAFLTKHAHSSHYDLLTHLSEKEIFLPDGVICLAGSSQKLHGQRGRPWIALEGNIHLTVYFAPQRKISHFGVGFPILAAVSLVEAIDNIKGFEGRSNIKWINDVLIDEAKVAGFLVHTSSVEDTVTSIILGIGLNVEKTPQVLPDSFIQKVASLRHFIRDASVCNRKNVLRYLLHQLSKNHEHLLAGKYSRLLESYRRRSLVIGRKVKVLSDPEEGEPQEIASGRVTGIGENLELLIEGAEKPVTKGRLIIES